MSIWIQLNFWGTREKVISKCFCFKKRRKRSIWFLSAQKYFLSERQKHAKMWQHGLSWLSFSKSSVRNLCFLRKKETTKKTQTGNWLYNELTEQSRAMRERAKYTPSSTRRIRNMMHRRKIGWWPSLLTDPSSSICVYDVETTHRFIQLFEWTGLLVIQ